LVAAFISNVGAIHEEMSRLSVDVGRLSGKIKAVHRGANRLHCKIDTARENLKFFDPSIGGVVANGVGLYQPGDAKSALESD